MPEPLTIRGIEADIGKEHADTFRNVQLPDLRAGTATHVNAKPRPRGHPADLLLSRRQLLANPPFKDSDWFNATIEPAGKCRAASEPELALAA